MSLIGIFYKATSGLNSFTQGLENLSNNIANVNTTGFKATDLFYTELDGQNNWGSSLGKDDGSAIGQGVGIAGSSIQFSQGDLVDTTNNTDMAIDGDGFFILTDGVNTTVYTRAGQFDMDKDGFLVDTTTGLKLQMLDNSGVMTDINLRQKLISDPVASTTAKLEGTLDNTDTEKTVYPGTTDSKVKVAMFDENGNSTEVFLQFTKELGRNWRVDFMDAQGAIIAPHHTLSFNSDNTPTLDTLKADITFELFSKLNEDAIKKGFTAGEPLAVNTSDIAATLLTTMTVKDGQFIVRDGETIHYSETGSYQLNDAGQLVDTATGDVLAAASTDGKLADVQINFVNEPVATTTVVANGSLFLDSPIGTAITIPEAKFQVYDLAGEQHDIQLTFTPTSSTSSSRKFDVTAKDASGADLDVSLDITFFKNVSDEWLISPSTSKVRVATKTGVTPAYAFDVNLAGDTNNSGLLVSTTTTNTLTSKVIDGRPEGHLTQLSFNEKGEILQKYDNGVEETKQTLALVKRSGSPITDFTVDFSAVSGLSAAGSNQIKTSDVDGRATGQLLSFNFAQDGVIALNYTNEDKIEIGTIALASFVDQSVLERYGDAMFESMDNSQRIIGKPDDAGLGSIKSKSLELSNVNLSDEFADIIIVQRGFQGASQVLTVTNELIEELYNSTRGR